MTDTKNQTTVDMTGLPPELIAELSISLPGAAGRAAAAEKARDAIRLRSEGMTLEKIGTALGVSRQRVHQMLRALS